MIRDVRFYLAFLLLMVFGFACSYYVLFRNDQGLPVSRKHGLFGSSAAHPCLTAGCGWWPEEL